MTQALPEDLPDPRTLPTAGFVLRLGAWLIDQFALAPLVLLTYYFMVRDPSLAGVVVIWLLSNLYKPLTESYLGWTVGKRILRMRVVDRGTYRKIGLNQSLTRYLPWAIASFVNLFVLIRLFASPEIAEATDLASYQTALITFPLNENFWVRLIGNVPAFSAAWLLTDPWNRALHDRLAATFVVRKLPEGQ